MGKKFKAIPDRWRAYSKFGSVVNGTRFFPFKVPLKEALSRSLLEDERFTPTSFVEHLNQNNKPLGLLIDLTNTQRYYCPMKFKNHNIRYIKIFCPGHGSVPSLKVVKRFYKAVDNFMNSDSEKEALVGVHCTHGINRTGYLICRYMIEKMNFSAAEALKAFAEARGYPIEREKYIEDLHNFQPLSSLVGSTEDDNDSDDDDNGNDAHRCNSCTGPSDISDNQIDTREVFIDNDRFPQHIYHTYNTSQFWRDLYSSNVSDNSWFSDPSEIVQYREMCQRNNGPNERIDHCILRNCDDKEWKPASRDHARHQVYSAGDYQSISYKSRRHQSSPDEIWEGDSHYNRTQSHGDNRKPILYSDMDSRTCSSSRRYHSEEDRERTPYKEESGYFTPPRFANMDARNVRQFHPYHYSSHRDVFQHRGGWQNKHYQLPRNVIDSNGYRDNYIWNDARHYLNGYSRLNRKAHHTVHRHLS